MNKYSKIIILFLTVIVLLIIAIAINKFKDNGDEKISEIISKNNITKVEEELSMLKAVIIRVDNDKFHVMSNVYGLITFKYNEDNNTNYKNGQEILIYYTDGIIQTAPARIGNVVNIEIVKENSDIQIPENIIKTVYNSKENVSMSVLEFTNTKISINIIDTNENPFNYSNGYKIFKYNENGIQALEEVPKISDVRIEDTVKNYENNKEKSLKKECDWTTVYGKLEERKILF